MKQQPPCHRSERPGRKAGARGFTLVELMVVVAIIAVLASLMIGISVRPYGANAEQVSQQIASTMTFARMRAVATRRVHRVQFVIASNGDQYASVYQAPSTGMVTPTSSQWTTCGNACLVQYTRFPNKSVELFAAQASVLTGSGNAPTQGANLPYDIYFKPDGSATGSTIFVKDRAGAAHYYRVYVYSTTGSSYVRETW